MTLASALKAIGDLTKDVLPSKRALVLFGIEQLARRALKASGVKIDPKAAAKFIAGKLEQNDALIDAYRASRTKKP